MKKKNPDLEKKLKRALADYDNLEKRITREKNLLVKLANAALIDKLLSVLDDLERVEKHRQDAGLQIAVDQFRQVLAGEGVEEIQAQGKKFDAQTMDCAEVGRGSQNQVVKVIKKGYCLHGRVLRPAQVKVGGSAKSS